jgi:hypothetical protein
MVQKYALYRVSHWLRANREQLSKVPLSEVKNRMIMEGLRRAAPASRSNRKPRSQAE